MSKKKLENNYHKDYLWTLSTTYISCGKCLVLTVADPLKKECVGRGSGVEEMLRLESMIPASWLVFLK